MSLQTAQPPRNGERPHTTADVPLPPEQPPQPPKSAFRLKRFEQAAKQVADWPAEYKGKNRQQVLEHTISLIKEFTECDKEDIAAVIHLHLDMTGKKPYTAQELREAVRKHTSSGPAPVKSGGCEPQRKPVETPPPTRPTPDITPPFVQEMRRRETAPQAQKQEPPELVGVMASQVVARDVEWFLPGLIARGYYTMVTGRQGAGKSTFFTGMAKLARRTIWLCGEERLENLVVPRLRAHDIPDTAVEFFTREHDLTFPQCKEAIIRRAKLTRTDLVIVDPLSAFFGHGLEEKSNEQMLTILQALDQIAEKCDAAVLVCLHPGKAANNEIRGASVFGTHPRVILQLVKDDGPPKRRLINNTKNNLIGEQTPIEFFADDVGRATKVFRLGEHVKTEETLFALEVPDRLERLVIQDCEDWLRSMLVEGPKSRKEIMAAGKDEAYSIRTVDRAADKMGVVREIGNRRKGEGSLWRLADWVEPTPWDKPPHTQGVG